MHKKVIKMRKKVISFNERSTNEHHVNELTEENKQKLKKCNILLVYLCFNSESLEKIRKEFNKLGIENIDILYSKDLGSKIFDENLNIFKDSDQRELVKKTLKDIGEKILLNRNKNEDGGLKDRWDLDRIEDSALGYNDAQQMVIFESNVPTYTICAFWTTEKDNQCIWKGLFQRTLKEDKI